MKYLLIGLLTLLSGCGTTSYVQVIKGEQGLTGPTGNSGLNGNDGDSCNVTSLPSGDASLPLGGAVITCNGNSVLVSNGTQGNQGQQGITGPTGASGQSAYSVSMVIDPCGVNETYDEVLLAFGNGTLVALFTNDIQGNYPRLSLIPDGSYMTSDTTSCNFNVSTSGNTRTVTWGNGSQSWNFN